MKTKISFSFFLFVFIAANVFSQSADIAEQSRQRIISDLVFVYVDQPQLPDSDPSASSTLPNADIANNTNLTGPFWTNSNNEGSQDLVKRLLQPASDQKTRRLQYLVAAILQINEKRVKVFLFNDNSNTSLTSIHSSWNIHPSLFGNNAWLTDSMPNPWVWPHADHRIQGEFAGWISMGSAFLTHNSSGREDAIATIIHELVHTQDNTQHATRFSVNPYGMDPSHSFDELLSNYYAAYVEGIANAFSMMYHFTSHVNVYSWYRSGKLLPYERTPHWACQNLPANSCLDVYLSSAHSISPAFSTQVPAGQNNQAFTRDIFNIVDLPSDVLVHNEGIQAIVFYTFMRYFSVAAMADCLKRARPQTDGGYGFAFIFEEMVKTAHALNDQSGSNAEYFPLAILDFCTGFKLNDESILNLCLRHNNTSNWNPAVTNYWTSPHRGRILDMHNNTYSGTSNVGLLFDVAVQYNIRSRQPSPAAGVGE